MACVVQSHWKANTDKPYDVDKATDATHDWTSIKCRKKEGKGAEKTADNGRVEAPDDAKEKAVAVLRAHSVMAAAAHVSYENDDFYYGYGGQAPVMSDERLKLEIAYLKHRVKRLERVSR